MWWMLILGVAFIGFACFGLYRRALPFLFSRMSFGYQELFDSIYRDTDPARFWFAFIFYIIAGLICVAVWVGINFVLPSMT